MEEKDTKLLNEEDDDKIIRQKLPNWALPIYNKWGLKGIKVARKITRLFIILLIIGCQVAAFTYINDNPTDLTNITNRTDVKVIHKDLEFSDEMTDIEKLEVIAEYRSRFIKVENGDIFINKNKLGSLGTAVLFYGIITLVHITYRIYYGREKSLKKFIVITLIVEIIAPIAYALIMNSQVIKTGIIDNLVQVSSLDILRIYIPKIVISNLLLVMPMLIFAGGLFHSLVWCSMTMQKIRQESIDKEFDKEYKDSSNDLEED